MDLSGSTSGLNSPKTILAYGRGAKVNPFHSKFSAATADG